MPTKLNSAGNQQPYIPAGNGDASGEYGNSEGGNKHFSPFGKGKKVTTTKNTPEERKKYYEDKYAGTKEYTVTWTAEGLKGDQKTILVAHDEKEAQEKFNRMYSNMKNKRTLKSIEEEEDDWGKWADETDKKVPESWKPDGFDGDTRFYTVKDQSGITGASVRPDGQTSIYTENGSITFNKYEDAEEFLSIKDKDEATEKLWERGWLGISEDTALDDMFGKEKPLQYSRDYDGLDKEFDVASPQETANLMGKPVEDNGKIYKPNKKGNDLYSKIDDFAKDEQLEKGLTSQQIYDELKKGRDFFKIVSPSGFMDTALRDKVIDQMTKDLGLTKEDWKKFGFTIYDDYKQENQKPKTSTKKAQKPKEKTGLKAFDETNSWGDAEFNEVSKYLKANPDVAKEVEKKLRDDHKTARTYYPNDEAFNDMVDNDLADQISALKDFNHRSVFYGLDTLPRENLLNAIEETIREKNKEKKKASKLFDMDL